MHSYISDPDVIPIDRMALVEPDGDVARKLDTTHLLSCNIESYHMIESFVEYVIRVHFVLRPTQFWRVFRRYRDFSALHATMCLDRFGISIPAKKTFGNTSKEFVENRRQNLQVYLDTILAHPVLCHHVAFKRFLDPVNYPPTFESRALEALQMALRGSSLYAAGAPLPGLGWRVARLYTAGSRRDVGGATGGTRLLVSWSRFGPDWCLTPAQTEALLKCLSTIECPYIQVHEHCRVSGTEGALLVTTHCASGSLRDLVTASRPGSACALNKMADTVTSAQRQPARCALLYHDICVICRQILEALRLLHKNDIPYGHLHSGNVLYENGVCRLTQLENSVLGVPYLYRDHLLRHRLRHRPRHGEAGTGAGSSVTAADVYGFGHILYELTFGRPLAAATLSQPLPADLTPQLAETLRSILSAEAMFSDGLPTVQDLLSLPLFADLVPPLPVSFRCRMGGAVRELFTVVRTAVDSRLRADHKQYRLQRRKEKTEVLLNSSSQTASAAVSVYSDSGSSCSSSGDYCSALSE